jgi:multiple sugar transport system substrate-binding protein
LFPASYLSAFAPALLKQSEVKGQLVQIFDTDTSRRLR